MTPRVWCEICGSGPDDEKAGNVWDGADAYDAAEQHVERHGKEEPFEDGQGVTAWTVDDEGNALAFDVRAAWCVNYIATPKEKP